MKQRIPLLLSIILTLCLVQGAAAADFVQNVADVEPSSGDLAPGEQVIVHVIIKLTGSGENTFDTNDELEAYTELEDPEWDYSILLNNQGIPKQTTSRYVHLLGWDLAYPDTNEVTVDYALSGKVPTVTETSDVTLFRLRQLDANGNVPSGGELLIKPIVIINPEIQYVTATASSSTIAKGEELYLNGTAEDNPPKGVALWILGDNCVSYATETVEEDGVYEYTFTNTANLVAGQYYVIVQHPMNNEQFDLVPQAGNPAPGQAAVVRPIVDVGFIDPLTGILPPLFIIEGSESLCGSDAAATLVNAMNNADVDDTCCTLTFIIEEPWVQIDPVDNRYVGDIITITGITNLAVEENLNIDITPVNGTISTTSRIAFVNAGDTGNANHWTFSVNTSTYTPERYVISVSADGALMATQIFNILEADLNHYVTITASGSSSYYIGEDIVLSGTNTGSNTTWFFITGPNLASAGAPITNPQRKVITGGTIVDDYHYAANWTGENVTAENTWEYIWDTNGVNLDAGTYKIYAVTTPTNKDDLIEENAIYATTSIVMKKPFVTATPSSDTVAMGDDMYITGTATGDPSPGVGIWIFGRNFMSYTNKAIGENITFKYQFTNTTNLAAGQYFAIIQHPMYNDKLDIALQTDNPAAGQTSIVRPIIDAQVATPSGLLPPVFIIEGSGSLRGSDAATALVSAMNSPDIDDTYSKLTFTIEQPWIQTNAISDRYKGETFTISGTTNIAADDILTYAITPLNSATAVQNGTFHVQAGATPGTNTFEFTTDSSSYAPGTFIVTVERIPISLKTTQSFTILQIEQNQDITINAIENSPYYLGEDILISGINNKSDTTWLFVSGPGLPETGGSFRDPSTGVNSATNANGLPVSPFYPDGYLDSGVAWNGVNVAADNTWECTWKDAGSYLEAGTYTIYAVTTATDKADLGSHQASYAIASISLGNPYVSATTSSSVIAKGDSSGLQITGNASAFPTNNVSLWIFGSDYFTRTTGTVEENGAFEFTLANATNLPTGQYYVVMQHPMVNNEFDIAPQANNPVAGQSAVVRPIVDAALADPGTGNLPPVFILEGPGSLQGNDAATALVNTINSEEIDDTSFRLTFMVEEPGIMIDAIGDKIVGDTFTITGTTNLAIGDKMLVNVTKTLNRTASCSSGTVPITAGDEDGENTWEFDIDTSQYTPDEYIITVEGVEATVIATQTFIVLKDEPAPEPTPVPTPQPTHDVTLQLFPGWNLISAPVDNLTTNASAFLYESAYGYNTTTAQYEAVPLKDLKPGEGYWVGAFEDAEITFDGVPLTEYQKELSKGWNLIGGLGIATETGSIHAIPDALSGPLYRYNPSEYTYSRASVLEPGQGYWASTTTPCTIQVNITPPVAPA